MIKIRVINNKKYLCSISTHSHGMSISIILGRIKYSKLEINKEYDLDVYKDFIVIEREKGIIHDGGLIYDDLTYIYKPQYLKYTRKQKLKKINCEYNISSI